jgi:hypothetical protein
MKKVKKIYEEEQYPIYEFTINENDPNTLSLISMVADPAIEVKGFYFNAIDEETKPQLFSDEEKRIVAGPVIIPNKKIKRKDENGNIYFGFFSIETIEKMVELLNKNLNKRPSGVINDEHSNRMVDAYIMGSWIIKDSQYDKSRTYGFDLPVGTFFMEVKVEDEDYWNKDVKEDGKFGFSIEALLGLKPANFSTVKEKKTEQWLEVLQELNWVVKDETFIEFLSSIEELDEWELKGPVLTKEDEDEQFNLENFATDNKKKGIHQEERWYNYNADKSNICPICKDLAKLGWVEFGLLPKFKKAHLFIGEGKWNSPDSSCQCRKGYRTTKGQATPVTPVTGRNGDNPLELYFGRTEEVKQRIEEIKAKYKNGCCK